MSIFLVRLEGVEDERTIHSLRVLLKALGRRHRFRCVSIVEEVMDDHTVERDERSK
jgi:hypothetical protein